jgi:hypothetical protein
LDERSGHPVEKAFGELGRFVSAGHVDHTLRAVLQQRGPMLLFLFLFLKHLLFATAHNDDANEVLKTALQCKKTLKNITGFEPGIFFKEADVMTMQFAICIYLQVAVLPKIFRNFQSR